jgi:hypothetical protein
LYQFKTEYFHYQSAIASIVLEEDACSHHVLKEADGRQDAFRRDLLLGLHQEGMDGEVEHYCLACDSVEACHVMAEVFCQYHEHRHDSAKMELLCLHDQQQNVRDHSYQFEKVVDGLGAP